MPLTTSNPCLPLVFDNLKQVDTVFEDQLGALIPIGRWREAVFTCKLDFLESCSLPENQRIGRNIPIYSCADVSAAPVYNTSERRNRYQVGENRRELHVALNHFISLFN